MRDTAGKGLDLAELGPTSWGSIGWTVQGGGHPARESLVAAILSGLPIPPNLRHYVASRIGDQVHGAPRHRPTASREEREARAYALFSLELRVLRREAELVATGEPAPRTKALQEIAQNGPPYYRSGEEVRRALQRARRTRPAWLQGLMPSREHFRAGVGPTAGRRP